MALKIKELHHQGLATPSAKLEDMLAFYTGVLGMTPDPGRPDRPGVPAGAWLYVGPDGEQTSQVHVIARDGVSEMARPLKTEIDKTHMNGTETSAPDLKTLLDQMVEARQLSSNDAASLARLCRPGVAPPV